MIGLFCIIELEREIQSTEIEEFDFRELGWKSEAENQWLIIERLYILWFMVLNHKEKKELTSSSKWRCQHKGNRTKIVIGQGSQEKVP